MKLRRRAAHDPSKTISTAKEKLRKLGLDVSGVEPIVHDTWVSMKAASSCYRREDLSRKKPRFSVIFLDYLTIGAFVSLVTGEVNIRNNATTQRTLHELVHARDYNRLSGIFNELVEGREQYDYYSWFKKIKFRIKETAYLAFLEGRATLSEYRTSEKFSEKVDALAKVSVTPMATFLVCTIATLDVYLSVTDHFVDAMARLTRAGQFLENSLPLVGLWSVFLLGTWVITANFITLINNNFPYTVGYNFMRTVEKEVGGVSNSLKVTEEHPPTVSEVFFPFLYIRRMRRENEEP